MSGKVNSTGAVSGVIGTTVGTPTGIKYASTFRLNSQFTTNDSAITDWNQTAPITGSIGTAVTESSGVFTLPEIGQWLVMGTFYTWNATDDNWMEIILYAASRGNLSHGISGSYGSHYKAGMISVIALVDIVTADLGALYFKPSSLASGSYVHGSSSDVHTSCTFVRLGD